MIHDVSYAVSYDVSCRMCVVRNCASKVANLSGCVLKMEENIKKHEKLTRLMNQNRDKVRTHENSCPMLSGNFDPEVYGILL